MRRPRAMDTLPAGGLVDPGQDQQQRGLADAVGPDQPDLAVVGDGDGDAAEQVEGSEGNSQIVSGKNRHSVAPNIIK